MAIAREGHVMALLCSCTNYSMEYDGILAEFDHAILKKADAIAAFEQAIAARDRVCAAGCTANAIPNIAGKS